MLSAQNYKMFLKVKGFVWKKTASAAVCACRWRYVCLPWLGGVCVFGASAVGVGESETVLSWQKLTHLLTIKNV